tara:strand:+ start:3831 stop:4130 length:300 start_codon:yes stop_codon:yes gene_type:complete
LPAIEIVTASEPELPVWLVQEAEHDVAFAEDQVKVEVFSIKTDIGSADKFTVGKGVVGVGEPPPPPHEIINNKQNTIGNFLINKLIKHILETLTQAKKN